MAYQKQPVQSGEVISSDWGNHIQTQYDEAKADLDAHLADYELFKQQEEPFQLTLKNGFTHHSGGLRCMKDSFGFVHIWGVIKDGLTDYLTVISEMPIGYRPINDYTALIASGYVSTTVGYEALAIDVHTDGKLTLMRQRSSTSFLKISGSYFSGGD